MSRAEKALTVLAVFLAVLVLAGGGAAAALLPDPRAKLACAGLALAGFTAGCAGWGASRAQVRAMARKLEKVLQQAWAGKAPDPAAFTGETITDRLGAQAARLADAVQSEAQRSEAAREQLQATVSDLAHQLRAPVANLALYTDTLAAGGMPPEKQAEFLKVLQGQTEKLEFLMDALVKTGRLETGAIRMQPRLLELAPTLERAAALARPLAAAKGLELAVECPEGLAVCHDPKWTAEAVFNLLDNAVKYTRAGSVRLAAERWELFTRISVQDTGPGFDARHAAQLFGRFYREPAAQSTEGMGLGLYIVRQIAQQQGGYTQARTRPGGAMFSIFLPSGEPGAGERYQN